MIDPDGSAEGWLSNVDYGAVALGEPLGSQGWFPVNNVPTDKATYDISVTTASDFQAVSNGVLTRTVDNGNGTTTYDWHGAEPMAPYLASVSIGRFDTSGSDFSNPDRPLYVYVDQSFTRAADVLIPEQQRVPEILDWYAGYYGVPYPFRAAGGVVPRVSASLGYVLETQTKPTYPLSRAGSGAVGIDTIAHENAHQWFGNLVTLARWKDIWLNEGITEFSSWLWSAEADGGTDMPTRFDDVYTDPDPELWVTPPADPPTAADIFDSERDVHARRDDDDGDPRDLHRDARARRAGLQSDDEIVADRPRQRQRHDRAVRRAREGDRPGPRRSLGRVLPAVALHELHGPRHQAVDHAGELLTCVRAPPRRP